MQVINITKTPPEENYWSSEIDGKTGRNVQLARKIRMSFSLNEAIIFTPKMLPEVNHK